MSKTKNLEFKVAPRQAGKHFSRTARKNKKIPGVIYGPKLKNFNVFLPELFVEKHRSPRYETTIFKTDSESSELANINVMLKKIDFHPVSGRPVHVDLYALDMSEKIKVNIQLKFEGEPIGCKEDGGVRQVLLHDIEIECSPADIPEEIPVDVSGIALNSSLKVSDINFPDNVKVITASDRAVITVSQPKEEKVETPEVAAADGAADAAAPAAAAAATPEKK